MWWTEYFEPGIVLFRHNAQLNSSDLQIYLEKSDLYAYINITLTCLLHVSLSKDL